MCGGVWSKQTNVNMPTKRDFINALSFVKHYENEYARNISTTPYTANDNFLFFSSVCFPDNNGF